MERKEFWVPLAVLGLTVLFAAVSLGVRATRGRSHWLIRRKLAVGAALLSLTWAASGCSDDGGGGVTCYVPAPPDNSFYFAGDHYNDQGLVLDLAEGTVLTGTIEHRTDELYSFVVVDSEQTQVHAGSIVPADGAYDEYTEAFQADLGPDLAAGQYELLVGAGNPSQVLAAADYAVPLIVLAPGP